MNKNILPKSASEYQQFIIDLDTSKLESDDVLILKTFILDTPAANYLDADTRAWFVWAFAKIEEIELSMKDEEDNAYCSTERMNLLGKIGWRISRIYPKLTLRQWKIEINRK